MAKSFYIIDGSSYIYRAYYAVRNLSTSRGMPTNAIYGITQMLLKILKQKPDYLAIAWDTPGPTFRHKMYEDYKAHRPSMPDDLSIQIPYIHRMMSALGLFTVAQEGMEADDLIGTLAKQGEAAGLQVTLITGDKDFFQLLSPAICIYDTLKEKKITMDDIRARFGVAPSQLIEIMGLTGDAVDNIPGVRGIGEKTAIELIGRFGTLEALFANVDAIEKKTVREKLQAGAESARLSRVLATIRTDCPIFFNPDTLTCSTFDTEKLFPLLEELEFMSLLKELRGNSVKAQVDSETYSWMNVSTFIQHLEASRGEALALLLMENEHLGLGCRFSGGNGFCCVDNLSDVPLPIRRILESDRFLKIGHNLKPLLILLCAQGITLSPPFFDTQLAAYLLDPSHGNETPAKTAERYLHQTTSTEFACLSALLKIEEALRVRLLEDRLFSLFTEIELPVMAILADMEKAGVKIDCARMAEIAADLQRALTARTEQIYALAGKTFNINSPKQLGHILFEVLGLPSPKKTKTGYSTDESVLTALAPAHRLPEEVLAYRQEMKFKTASVDPLLQRASGDGHFITGACVAPSTSKACGDSPSTLASARWLNPVENKSGTKGRRESVAPIHVTCSNASDLFALHADHKGTGRVHTTFHQTVTATGRLSSSDPNLQNIPIQGEWGARIRETFIVEEGCLLVAADYNQIELRILAHFSQDPALISAYCTGTDLHQQTAMEIFGLPAEQMSSEMRRVGKTVNFGILYGISPFGLASQLGIPQSDAKRYMDLYFARYPGVTRFIEETVTEVQRKGYVTTLCNRRRSIPEITDRNKKIQELGTRLAVNTRIQGSAADIIKVAMRDIFRWMKDNALQSRMILQVHDELLFEVPEGEIPAMCEGVALRMRDAVALSVPLVVDVGVGPNWRAAKG